MTAWLPRIVARKVHVFSRDGRFAGVVVWGYWLGGFVEIVVARRPAAVRPVTDDGWDARQW